MEGGFEALADEIVRSNADFVTLSEVRNYRNTRFCDRIVEALKREGKPITLSIPKTPAC